MACDSRPGTPSVWPRPTRGFAATMSSSSQPAVSQRRAVLEQAAVLARIDTKTGRLDVVGAMRRATGARAARRSRYDLQ